MVEISSIMVSSVIGMFGVVVGAVISNYFNQKIARQSARKDIVFKKKIEYFERILECIDSNIELYKNSIRLIEHNYSTKQVSKVINDLKLKRKRFEIKNSPLYMDIRKMSGKIIQFVDKEKSIFFYLEGMKENKIAKERAIYQLNLDLEKLKEVGGQIVLIMRSGLFEE